MEQSGWMYCTLLSLCNTLHHLHIDIACNMANKSYKGMDAVFPEAIWGCKQPKSRLSL